MISSAVYGVRRSLDRLSRSPAPEEADGAGKPRLSKSRTGWGAGGCGRWTSRVGNRSASFQARSAPTRLPGRLRTSWSLGSYGRGSGSSPMATDRDALLSPFPAGRAAHNPTAVASLTRGVDAEQLEGRRAASRRRSAFARPRYGLVMCRFDLL